MAERTTVDVLHCPACGSAIPFGDGDVATCPYCRNAVPIPAPHRTLRQQRHAEEGLRRESEKLLERLDHPPGIALKVFVGIFDQPLFSFWMLFGVPVAFLGILGGMAMAVGLQKLRDLPLREIPIGTATGLSALTILLLVLIPRVLGIYASRRAVARTTLVRGFAARPPKIAGGPAECRLCGAPLEVVPDALVARCLYCGADNALRLRTELLVKTRAAVGTKRRTLAQAISEDERERHALRRAAARTLASYGIRGAIGGGLAAVMMWDIGRAQGSDDAPLLGLAAAFVLAIALIASFVTSASKKPSAAEEPQGKPAYGCGFLVALWVLAALASRIASW